MGTVRGTGRGVGVRPLGARLRATGPRVRIATGAGLLALGVATLPSAGVMPFGAVPFASPGQAGSDRVAEVTRQIRVTQAQIQATETQVNVLTRRRDQMAADLEVARSLDAELTALVKQAKSEARSTAKELARAEAGLAEAGAARKSAKAQFEAAEAALATAQERLEEVSARADAAQDAVRAAEHRVGKSGAKSRRSAFTDWQMAAVADLAAHARQMIADDRAADEFVGLQAAEAVLTEAEFAQDEAESAQARATRAASKAASRLAEARTDRSATRATLTRLEPGLAQVRAALKSSTKLLGTLTERLARLQQSATVPGQPVAGGRLPMSPGWDWHPTHVPGEVRA